ncbi:hypothetical protein FCV25MIE_19505, partial [Fagus crenata]
MSRCWRDLFHTIRQLMVSPSPGLIPYINSGGEGGICPEMKGRTIILLITSAFLLQPGSSNGLLLSLK